ncbi:hypothetical protein ACJIZ3_020611 [Penstemon smallii]|uniref:ZF-HD dimerization-type domain-containing protein n=1 Tax=Penstemon smallii TaxID=265156 RepID=A0ABD3SJ43_9LAMI
MEDEKVIYMECCKNHATLREKTDGCQEFMWGSKNLECAICGCHRNFHRRVVYTKCNKIHVSQSGSNYVDGCMEFIPDPVNKNLCDGCKCHKSFHKE